MKGKTLYMIMRGLEQARHAMSNCRLRMRVATLIYCAVLWRVSVCFVLVAWQSDSFLCCIQTAGRERSCGKGVVTKRVPHSMRSATETDSRISRQGTPCSEATSRIIILSSGTLKWTPSWARIFQTTVFTLRGTRWPYKPEGRGFDSRCCH